MPLKAETRRWPCGYNPAERDRRLKSGLFVAHTVSHSLHDDMGEVVETITKEVRTLRFKKAGA